MTELDRLFAQQNQLEFEWLLSHVRGATSLLEIGSCFGRSLCAFACAMAPEALIRSVDLGRAGPEWPNSGAVLQSRILGLRAKGFNAEVLFADSKSQQAVMWARRWAPYDVVFIDGDHSYEGVKADWLNYGDMGKIVAFHDIRNPHEPGVSRLWQEISAAQKTEECVCSGMGIGMVRKPLPGNRVLLRDDFEPCRDNTVMLNPDMAQIHLWHAQAQRDRSNISDREMAKVEGVASVPASRARVLWNPFTGQFRTAEIANYYKSGDYLRYDGGGRITRLLSGE